MADQKPLFPIIEGEALEKQIQACPFLLPTVYRQPSADSRHRKVNKSLDDTKISILARGTSREQVCLNTHTPISFSHSVPSLNGIGTIPQILCKVDQDTTWYVSDNGDSESMYSQPTAGDNVYTNQSYIEPVYQRDADGALLVHQVEQQPVHIRRTSIPPSVREGKVREWRKNMEDIQSIVDLVRRHSKDDSAVAGNIQSPVSCHQTKTSRFGFNQVPILTHQVFVEKGRKMRKSTDIPPMPFLQSEESIVSSDHSPSRTDEEFEKVYYIKRHNKDLGKVLLAIDSHEDMSDNVCRRLTGEEFSGRKILPITGPERKGFITTPRLAQPYSKGLTAKVEVWLEQTSLPSPISLKRQSRVSPTHMQKFDEEHIFSIGLTWPPKAERTSRIHRRRALHQEDAIIQRYKRGLTEWRVSEELSRSPSPSNYEHSPRHNNRLSVDYCDICNVGFCQTHKDRPDSVPKLNLGPSSPVSITPHLPSMRFMSPGDSTSDRVDLRLPYHSTSHRTNVSLSLPGMTFPLAPSERQPDHRRNRSHGHYNSGHRPTFVPSYDTVLSYKGGSDRSNAPSPDLRPLPSPPPSPPPKDDPKDKKEAERKNYRKGKNAGIDDQFERLDTNVNAFVEADAEATGGGQRHWKLFKISKKHEFGSV
jgi:hypothetical protein